MKLNDLRNNLRETKKNSYETINEKRNKMTRASKDPPQSSPDLSLVLAQFFLSSPLSYPSQFLLSYSPRPLLLISPPLSLSLSRPLTSSLSLQGSSPSSLQKTHFPYLSLRGPSLYLSLRVIAHNSTKVFLTLMSSKTLSFYHN